MHVLIYGWSRESETLGQKEKWGRLSQKIFLVDHVEPLKNHEQENGTKEAVEAPNWASMRGWGQTMTEWMG